MSKELQAISNGTFVFQETEKENQFYFYRKDMKPLTDIDNEPMEMYQAYITHKMMSGEMPIAMIMSNLYSEMSDDQKVIKVTVSEVAKDTRVHKPSIPKKKKISFFKKIFGKAQKE